MNSNRETRPPFLAWERRCRNTDVDAAGLIAPLAGDGIAMALQSGIMAGEQASEFLAGNSSAAELLHGYEVQWRHQFNDAGGWAASSNRCSSSRA